MVEIYALVFGILLTSFGALFFGASSIDAFAGILIHVADTSEAEKVRRARSMAMINAFLAAVGTALFVHGGASWMIVAGYPDLATFSGIAGLQNIYLLAQVVILPALICALASLAMHHVSAYLPYILLTGVQGLAIYAMSSVGGDILAYLLFSMVFVLAGAMPISKLVLSGELLATSGNAIQAVGRLTATLSVVFYMVVLWLMPFLYYNIGAVGLDAFLWVQAPAALGLFVLMALAGIASAYDRAPKLTKLSKIKISYE